MRKIFIGFIAALSISTTLHAQQPLQRVGEQMNMGSTPPTFNQQGLTNGTTTGRDSSVVDRGVPHDVRMFCIDPTLGTIIPVATDTAIYNFQNLHFTDGLNGEYSHLGNMGSPRLSRIFFNRTQEDDFLFTDGLDFFLTAPG